MKKGTEKVGKGKVVRKRVMRKVVQKNVRKKAVRKLVGQPMEKLVIDHNNEETVEDTLAAGAWAAFTIYPHTKMGSERMVEIVKKYGPERILVDSSADWGVSDPLSVPKTAKRMLERQDDEVWDVLDEVPHVQWTTLADPARNLFCVAEHPPAG